MSNHIANCIVSPRMSVFSELIASVLQAIVELLEGCDQHVDQNTDCR